MMCITTIDNKCIKHVDTNHMYIFRDFYDIIFSSGHNGIDMSFTVTKGGTHSGASFVINFASLSPASAWPSLA